MGKAGLAILIALAGTAMAQAQPPALVHAREPEAFGAGLAAMGYRPGAPELVEGVPVIRIEIGGQPTALAFGGCTDGRNCGYVVFTTSFTDVEPRSDWLERMNDLYDLVKLGRSREGGLSIRSGVVLGPEGIPVTTMRMILDQWQAALGEVAQQAIDAKLLRP